MSDLTPAITHLSLSDPHLAAVIAASPPYSITPHTEYYRALIESIIGQQLSVKAAHSIKLRFRALFGTTFPEPAQILVTDSETLRSSGLSRAKARYIHDLAEHIVDGRLNFGKIATEIVSELLTVKGIGEWTAHMFLIFCVGRLDILATGDLGIRNSIRTLYGFSEAVTPAQVVDVAHTYHWHPYESVACWYLWRALDNAPTT
jgi:DNA-3-methyladenine glycosylase II